jgi:hypothetical protein
LVINFTLDILYKEKHMQDYKDTYLENQARQIARLQNEGKFIAADEYLAERLPLPRVDELPGVEYDAKHYGYVAPWGRLARGSVPGTWLLVEGNPPEKQSPIRSATARVQENRVFIILDEQLVPTPERWLAGENAYNLLARVNAGLVKDLVQLSITSRILVDCQSCFDL